MTKSFIENESEHLNGRCFCTEEALRIKTSRRCFYDKKALEEFMIDSYSRLFSKIENMKKEFDPETKMVELIDPSGVNGYNLAIKDIINKYSIK